MPFNPVSQEASPDLIQSMGGRLRTNWILLCVLVLAFASRIYGIWNADSSDEYNEVFEALRVCSGHLNYERWFKRFYLYILSLQYGLFYIVGWLFGQFASPADFAAKIIRDMTPLFIIGRVTSALMGTFSVFMTYRIGSLLYGKNVGLLASLFLALNAVNIELSHYARVDATLCAVVLTSFYFIAKMLRSEEVSLVRYYAFAGLFCGIAFQNKIPSVILLIPFGYAHLARVDFTLSVRKVLNRNLVVFCALFLIGMAIGNPAILIAPLKFVGGVLSMGEVFTTPINETRSDSIGYVAYLHYFYKELGLPLTVLAVFSIWRAVIRRAGEDLLLLSFILSFYGLMGASRYMVSNSYMIPLMPFLYILCAKGLFGAFNRSRMQPHLKGKVLVIAVLIVLVIPITNMARLVASFSGKNTRNIAKEWIEQKIPFGTRILMDSGKTINSAAPDIAQNKDSILRSIEEIRGHIASQTFNDPTKMVDQNAVKYYEMLLLSVPENSYDITSTKFGLEVKNIDFYRNSGYKYFIISEGRKLARSDTFTAARYREVHRFYSSLDTDPRLVLVKVIAPNPTSRGDTFLIYQVM